MCVSHRNAVSKGDDATGCVFTGYPIRDPEHELLAPGGVIRDEVHACIHCGVTESGSSMEKCLEALNRARASKDKLTIERAKATNLPIPKERLPLRTLNSMESHVFDEELRRRKQAHDKLVEAELNRKAEERAERAREEFEGSMALGAAAQPTRFLKGDRLFTKGR